MNNTEPITATRQAAINGLAVVGFVALVVAGIALSVYSTRFVPTVVNRIGAAAVYLGEIFNPSPDGGLSVVPSPTASTTIPFGTTTPSSTPKTGGESVAPATPKKPAPVQSVETAAPALYGRPDLQITVRAIGYLATSGQFDSFVPSASVPEGKQSAVEFTVRNIGTNISGTWRLSSEPELALSHTEQRSLLPNEQRNFVIYLDRVRKSSQPLTITILSQAVLESNTENNSISLTFTLD